MSIVVRSWSHSSVYNRHRCVWVPAQGRDHMLRDRTKPTSIPALPQRRSAYIVAVSTRDWDNESETAPANRNVRDAAVFTAGDQKRDLAHPLRGATDASVFRDKGISHRLASDECRQVRGRGRGPCRCRVDKGRAARL